MIKKQAQERIFNLFFSHKKFKFYKSDWKKIERMRINERIYGRGRRSLSPQVPPGGWDRDDDEDSDCKSALATILLNFDFYHKIMFF